MRRSSRLTLFTATEPDVYLFDTSAWLNIDAELKCNEVWALIGQLTSQKRLFTCSQVLQELHDDPIYLLRIKAIEKALLSADRGNDPAFLLRVGRITHDFPSMGKATSPKTPADPYIVALAQLDGLVVVADETTKRRNRKIPGVCQHLGIRCMTLPQFINAELK